MVLFEKFIDKFVYFDIKRNIDKSIKKINLFMKKKYLKL